MATDAILTNSVSLSALTDVGKAREHNEDNFIICPDLAYKDWYLTEKPMPLSKTGTLLVVADGMGGTNAGEVASELAVESIKHFFSSLSLPPEETLSEKQAKEYLRESILTAHEAILSHADTHPACAGMGTTVILAWVMPAKAIIAWCGDSRGYLYRPAEGLKIITRDHSLVWEMVEAGKLSLQEADVHPDSNIITQSLGDPEHAPKPDLIVQPLQPSDKILLCSDGLNNMVNSETIAAILSQEKPLPEINKELIEAANTRGGKDNTTVVLLEVSNEPALANNSTPSGLLKKYFTLFLGFAGLVLMLLLWWALATKSTAQAGSNNLPDDEKSIPVSQQKNQHK